MSSDEPSDITSPISQVNNRVLPATSIKRAQAINIEARIGQLQRQLAALVAASEHPPMQQRASFKLDGMGELRTVRLGEFHLADESDHDTAAFRLSFEYQGREALKHVTESEIAHKALRDALYGHGLVFRSASSMTTHRIEVEPKVPAVISVKGGKDDTELTLSISNVLNLGETRYTLPAKALDRKLTEALVELISSGDHRFYELAAKLNRRR